MVGACDSYPGSNPLYESTSFSWWLFSSPPLADLGVCVGRSWCGDSVYHLILCDELRRNELSPTSPTPNSTIELGSGTAC